MLIVDRRIVSGLHGFGIHGLVSSHARAVITSRLYSDYFSLVFPAGLGRVRGGGGSEGSWGWGSR